MPTEIELLLVFVTDDFGRYLYAKSLLAQHAIDYLATGEELRMTHGWNDERLTDTPLAPVEFWVRSGEAARARAVLKELEAQSSSSGDA